jgi:hypothetical protein
MDAADAFECFEMGAEFFVGVVVTAFPHEVEIELAEKIGKGIGIKSFDGFAVACTEANAVVGGSRRALMRIRKSGFKETYSTQLARRDGLGNALEEEAGVRGTGAEESNDPTVTRGMRTEQGEWIDMAAGEQCVDLSFQLCVFGWWSGACERRGRWLFLFRHGVLLRSGCMRLVTEAGYSVQGGWSGG